MRWQVVSCLVLSACAEQEKSSFLTAVRPVNGVWEVITPRCGTTIDTPQEPYELAIIEYASWGSAVRVLQAGPGDDAARSVSCPDSPPRPEEHEIDISTSGVMSGAPGSEVAGRGWSGPAPGRAFAHLGVQDVVAVSYEDVPRYIISREENVTARGLAFDFEREGAVFERRPLTVMGANGLRYEWRTDIQTAGGTAQIAPHPFVPVADVVSLFPGSALLEGDRRTLHVSIDGTPSPRSVTLDVPATSSGPIAVTLPPPVDDVDVVVAGSMVSLQVASSGSWNEHTVGLAEADGGRDHPPHRWELERRRGWPGTDVRFPDVATIPGWQDAWNIRPDFFSSYVELCDRSETELRCAGSRNH